MNHPTRVLDHHVEDLARLVADLRYDALAAFLTALGGAIADDAKADKERGREKLAIQLYSFSDFIKNASEECQDIFEFCKPFMQEELTSARKITLFTDGSCLGNPGPGGWAVLTKVNNVEVARSSGKVGSTTNNRMELEAVIRGLTDLLVMQQLTGELTNVPITIYSDSEYVIKGASKWLPNWIKKNWRTASGKPVQNQDLWNTVEILLRKFAGIGSVITWEWVRGHAGHPENELVDRLAQAMAREATP